MIRPNSQKKASLTKANATGSPMPSLIAMQDTGYEPIATVSGDFNGDGNIDWATAMLGDNTIWVYLGNGDGTWRDPEIIGLKGPGPIGMVGAHLRSSDKLDLVVAESNPTGASFVGVLLSNGDGTFQPEVDYALPTDPESIVCGDFNGDGKPDIVVGNDGGAYLGSVSFLAGDGTGKLGVPKYTSDQYPDSGEALSTGDFNGDGKLDLIIVGIPGVFSGVAVALGNGDGTFSTGQELTLNGATGPILTTAVGDVDHDGCLDAVLFDLGGTATFFKGNCDGTFQTSNPAYTPLGDAGASAFLVDLNGDGNLDIVGGGDLVLGTDAENEGNIVFVALGDGKGGFGSAATDYRTGSVLFGLAVADLHNSGKPDVIAPSLYYSTLAVLANDGTGHFAAPSGVALEDVGPGSLNASASAPVVLDLNKDGLPDIAILRKTPGSWPSQFFLSDLPRLPDGNFGLLESSDFLPYDQASTYTSSYAFGDFRGTGAQDVVALGAFTIDPGAGAAPFLYFAPNDGSGNFASGTLTNPAGATGAVGVGDFNGDGKLDVVAAGADANGPILTAFHGNGDGTFVPQPSLSLSVSPYPDYWITSAIFVGDFNGDGKLDVLAQYSDDASSYLFEAFGDGKGNFTGLNTVAQGLAPIFVADLNHDGLPDFVTGDSKTSRPGFSVYLGQPTGGFSGPRNYTPYLDMKSSVNLVSVSVITPSQPFNGGPLLGDFDGDGNIDVVMAENDGTTPETRLFYATGNGDGTFTQHLLRYEMYAPHPPTFVGDTRGQGVSGLLQVDSLPSAITAAAGASTHATFAIEFRALPVSSTAGHLRLLLDAPATASTSFNLSSDNSQVQLPSQVTVAAGATYTDIDFPLSAGFDFTHAFVVTASQGDESHRALGYAVNQKVPAIAITPAFLDFGNVDYGIPTTPQTATLTNFGDAPFVFSHPPFVGSQFQLVSTTCGAQLQPGASCSAQIAADPNNEDGDALSPRSAGYFEAIGNAATATIPLWAYGVTIQTTLIVSPSTLNFAAAFGLTSTPQSVTVTNTGSQPLVFLNPVTVNPPFQLTETTCTQAVAPQGICQLTFMFVAPTSGQQISFSGDAGLYGDFPNSSITLNATIASGQIQASPSSLNFGTVTGNTSSTQTITLSNTSQDALYISAFQFSTGVNDAGDTCTNTTLAAIQTCTIMVNVTSSQSGSFSGTITVASTAVNNPSLSIPVSATFSVLGLTLGANSSTSLTLAAGGVGNETVVLYETQAKIVNLSCASTSLLCALSPASVAGPVTSSNVVVSITATEPTASLRERSSSTRTWLAFLLPLGTLPLVFRRRRSRRWLAGILMFVGLLSISACGGGTSPSPPPPSGPVNTPAGAYTVTLTANDGTNTATQAFTVTVQ